VSAGGEVVVSGSGDFQSIGISSAISIIAPRGVHASIQSPITIAPGATDVVLLSGLDLHGAAGSSSSVVSIYNGLVTIDDCLLSHGSPGIGLTAGQLSVKNSLITAVGIGVLAFAGQVTVDNSTIVAGTAGSGGEDLTITNGAQAVITNSVLTGSGLGFALSIYTQGSGTSNAVIDNCVVTNQNTAISAGASSTTVVSNSTFSYNATALIAGTGAQILSRQNNTFFGNGADGSFTGTISPK
jgi:hypothetical protein